MKYRNWTIEQARDGRGYPWSARHADRPDILVTGDTERLVREMIDSLEDEPLGTKGSQ